MREYKSGDVVRYYTKKYGYQYMTVSEVKNGKVVCRSSDADGLYRVQNILPSRLEYVPPMIIEPDLLKKFAKYEISYSEMTGGIYPIELISSKEKIEITAEDFLSVLNKIKSVGRKTSFDEWIYPLHHMYNKIFVFSRAYNDNDGIRYLPTESGRIFDLFHFGLYLLDEDPDIERMIKETEEVISMRSVPVPLRDYNEESKEWYIRRLDRAGALESASDKEVRLFVQYTDELCEKGNETALYTKAYSCYGGSFAYECDWYASRDALLKLMEISTNPNIANTLGYIYYYGRCNDGVPEYDKAFYYFSIGAAGGVDESRYKVADMFLNGYGVPKNTVIASKMINEIYEETLEGFSAGNYELNFADVAFRMGNLYKNGIDIYRGFDDEHDYDTAYYYYLEAAFAIKRRMETIDNYGDVSVAKRIQKSIEEVLPLTSYSKPRYTFTHDDSFSYCIFKSAFATKHKIEAKIKKNGSGKYTVRFRIVPLYSECVKKFFVSIPEAHFCGYMKYITVELEDFSFLKINGKKFDGEEATVVFDNADNSDFYLDNKEVMSTDASFKLRIKKESLKKHTFVFADFDGFSKNSAFLCDISDISEGDKVVVRVNDKNYKVKVEQISEKSESELARPISTYHRVLRKA